MHNKNSIGVYLVFGFILFAVLSPVLSSASGNNEKMMTDTLPKKNVSAKKVKNHSYNKQTKKMTIVFTDGTREVMSPQTAVKKGYVIPPKVDMTRFTPPVIIKDSVSAQTKQDPVFVKVEIEPSVDPKAWNSHLEKNIGQNIKTALEQKIPAGQYTIMVRFIVEANGSVTSATSLNDPGYGLGKAASTLVLSGPKWKPGQQNGRLVRAFKTHPVSFVIEK
jgi:hypothetical protein